MTHTYIAFAEREPQRNGKKITNGAHYAIVNKNYDNGQIFNVIRIWCGSKIAAIALANIHKRRLELEDQ